MTARTVENRTSSTPITDALYGKKGARRKKPAQQRRVNPRHTFSVGANLSPETFTALETLKGELSDRPAKKRRPRRRKERAS